MSFGWSAATWMAIGTSVSAATTIDARERGRKAANTARDDAMRTESEATRQNNKANARSPDVAGMLAANLLAGKNGASGTMLTGPSGIDPSTLALGRTSLLGG